MGEVVSKEFYDDIKQIINESRKNVRNYANIIILRIVIKNIVLN